MPTIDESKEETKAEVIIDDSDIVKKRKEKIKMAFSLFDKEKNGTVIEEWVIISANYYSCRWIYVYFIHKSFKFHATLQFRSQ